MAVYIYWFLLALVLLGLEMATGTFYLLVLSLAMAIGGFAALLDAGVDDAREVVRQRQVEVGLGEEQGNRQQDHQQVRSGIFD